MRAGSLVTPEEEWTARGSRGTTTASPQPEPPSPSDQRACYPRGNLLPPRSQRGAPCLSHASWGCRGETAVLLHTMCCTIPFGQKTQTHHFYRVYTPTVTRSSPCNPPNYDPYS